jgi:hypothetical protein
MKGSGLELALEVANDRNPTTEVQGAVTPFATFRNELHGYAAFLGDLPNASNEF